MYWESLKGSAANNFYGEEKEGYNMLEMLMKVNRKFSLIKFLEGFEC